MCCANSLIRRTQFDDHATRYEHPCMSFSLTRPAKWDCDLLIMPWFFGSIYARARCSKNTSIKAWLQKISSFKIFWAILLGYITLNNNPPLKKRVSFLRFDVSSSHLSSHLHIWDAVYEVNLQVFFSFLKGIIILQHGNVRSELVIIIMYLNNS